ncbi:MAG: hypothetical protein HOP13_17560 [Alphaproteobacteria bacterium]|nr:hypothetical protein [Alphaproteobacteria bacterium]
MTKPSLADDVDYLRDLAESGATGAPSGGKYFIVWSLVIATGLILTYAAATKSLPIAQDQLNYVWAAVLAAGWAASFLMGSTDSAKPESARFANRLTSAMWIATGIGLTAIFAGLTISGVANQALMMPIAAAVSGVATVASAIIFRIRWLYAIAVAWWIVAFASFFLLGRIEFILFSAAAILLLQGGTGVALLLAERRRTA